MKYQWLSSRDMTYGNADDVVAELERLRKQAPLTYKEMWDAAKNPKNPLHHLLEWDKNIAAYRYQCTQLRQALSHIVFARTQRRVYALVRPDDDVPYYELVTRVMQSPKLRRPLARRALLSLHRWKVQYADLPELKSALRTVERILKSQHQTV